MHERQLRWNWYSVLCPPQHIAKNHVPPSSASDFSRTPRGSVADSRKARDTAAHGMLRNDGREEMLPIIGRSAACRRLYGVVAIFAMIAAAMAPTAVRATSLNALVWCDHADPELIAPFEEANGVTVNVKEYEGTGAGLALVEQSQPGDWDVLVIDAIDVRRGRRDRPVSRPCRRSQLPHRRHLPRGADGPEHHGRTASVTPSPRSSATTPSPSTATRSIPPTWRPDLSVDPKYQGRIAVYDYYLPVIGMAAIATRQEDRRRSPPTTSPPIKDVLLKWKADGRLVGEVSASADRARDRRGRHPGRRRRVRHRRARGRDPALDWVIPEEGGGRWVAVDRHVPGQRATRIWRWSSSSTS